MWILFWFNHNRNLYCLLSALWKVYWNFSKPERILNILYPTPHSLKYSNYKVCSYHLLIKVKDNISPYFKNNSNLYLNALSGYYCLQLSTRQYILLRTMWFHFEKYLKTQDFDFALVLERSEIHLDLQ